MNRIHRILESRSFRTTHSLSASMTFGLAETSANSPLVQAALEGPSNRQRPKAMSHSPKPHGNWDFNEQVGPH